MSEHTAVSEGRKTVRRTLFRLLICLAILEQYGVKATFFVTGRESEQGRQWMRDIVAAGHALGIHSYTHGYHKIYASVEAFLDDFNRMYQQIQEVTGVSPQIFRFPGGASTPITARSIWISWLRWSAGGSSISTGTP